MVSKPKTRSPNLKAKNAVKQHFEDVSLIACNMAEEGQPPKVGRPQYIPNEKHYQIVRALCLFGAPHEYIAYYVGISAKTLRKHYPELLKDCKEDKNYSVESSLFIQALRGNVDACKYWLDNHLKDKYNKNPQQADPGANNNQEFLNSLAGILSNAHKIPRE